MSEYYFMKDLLLKYLLLFRFSFQTRMRKWSGWHFLLLNSIFIVGNMKSVRALLWRYFNILFSFDNFQVWLLELQFFMGSPQEKDIDQQIKQYDSNKLFCVIYS